MIVIKLLSGVFSFIKLFGYKCIYMSKLRFHKISSCYLGNGSKILLNSQNSSVEIGKKLVCREYVRIKSTKGNIKLGDKVFFNNGCSVNCREYITIGDNCIFGENVKIYDHDHIYSEGTIFRDNGYIEKGITIGKNVWVGSNTVILKGVSIGDNVVIGAGTVVRKNIPSDKIVYNDMKIITRGI